MQHATTHFSRYRRLSSVTAVIVLAFGTAACGSDDNSADNSAADTSAADTTSPPATAAPGITQASSGKYGSPATDATTASPSAGEASVAVAETDLGTILVDGEGRTLYMFAPDAQGPSTCEDSCLATWPSLTGPATAGAGVDASMLATAARPDDGSEQVTYDGWPLYHFSKDAAPGEINGQGVGNVWYVVDPSGAPIGMAAG